MIHSSPNRRLRAVAMVGAALALVPGEAVSAAPPVKTFVDFGQASERNSFGGDPLARPEGIARDGANGYFVTGFAAGRVYHVDPGGGVTLFAQLPATERSATTGVARDGRGNLYVAHRGAPEHTGLWKIGPAGGTYDDDPAANPDAPRKFFPFDAAHAADITHPNGVTLDRYGDIFVSDSRGARIYKVAPTSTPASPQESVWAEGPELAGLLTGVGVNGLQAEHAGDALYAAHFDGGKVLRLSVREPANVHPIETLVSLPPLAGGFLLDGLTIDGADERLYVTAAGKVNLVTFSLEPGEEVLALNVRPDCLASGGLPVTSTADARLTSAARDPLLGVATDVVLAASEQHLFAVNLDYLNAGQAGGAVLRAHNAVTVAPACQSS